MPVSVQVQKPYWSLIVKLILNLLFLHNMSPILKLILMAVDHIPKEHWLSPLS